MGHAYVVDVNQELFAELVKLEDLEIALVIPSIFNTDLRGRLKPSILPNFKGKIFAIRPLFSGKNRLLVIKAYTFTSILTGGSLLRNLSPI